MTDLVSGNVGDATSLDINHWWKVEQKSDMEALDVNRLENV